MSDISHSELVGQLRDAGCVFAEDEADLLLAEAGSAEILQRLIDRRVSGEPLEYVLGWAEFCGLRIQVDEGVFVPRRRTGFLAAAAIELIGMDSVGMVVLDMCCGSGAVGAAVLASRPRVEIFAADISIDAVRCARRNLPASKVFQGDLFQALPESLTGRVQILVANAPYVPTPAISLLPHEARDYEPLQALDGGPDGLDIHRAVLLSATRWLTPDGCVLVETSQEQAGKTKGIFTAAGFQSVIARSEEFDATIVIGRLG